MSDYCNFCLKPLVFDQHYYWLYCPYCNVTFNYKTDHDTTLTPGTITWDRIRIKDYYYALIFDLFKKETSLHSLDSMSTDSAGKFTEELSLSHILKNITPTNVKAKIKTLLTFS